MGIKDFVSSFLKAVTPDARIEHVNPFAGLALRKPSRTAAADRESATWLVMELAPLIMSMQLYTPASARAEEQKRAEAEGIDADEVPHLAFSNSESSRRFNVEEDGSFQTRELAAAIENRFRVHLQSATDGDPRGLIVVGDTRGNLMLKASTRAARASAWFVGQRKLFPDTKNPDGSAPDESLFRYPRGCTFCDEGITLPSGKTVKLDVARVMFSNDNELVKKLYTYIFDWITQRSSVTGGRNAITVVDLGNDLPVAQIIGRNITEEQLVIATDEAKAAVQEMAMEPILSRSESKTVYESRETTKHPLVAHQPLEGDMMIAKYMASLHLVTMPQRAPQTIVIDTVDTDPVGVLLSFGAHHHVWLRRVIWYSNVSGQWDLNIVERRLAEHSLDNSNLLIAFHLLGTDFVKKRWFTDRIGVASMWIAFLKAGKAENKPRLWTSGDPGNIINLDFLLRAVYAEKAGALENTNLIPEWNAIVNVKKKKTQQQQQSLDAASSSSSNSSPPPAYYGPPEGVPGSTPSKFASRALVVAKAVNYWASAGLYQEATARNAAMVREYQAHHVRGRLPDEFDDPDRDDDNIPSDEEEKSVQKGDAIPVVVNRPKGRPRSKKPADSDAPSRPAKRPRNKAGAPMGGILVSVKSPNVVQTKNALGETVSLRVIVPKKNDMNDVIEIED